MGAAHSWLRMQKYPSCLEFYIASAARSRVDRPINPVQDLSSIEISLILNFCRSRVIVIMSTLIMIGEAMGMLDPQIIAWIAGMEDT